MQEKLVAIENEIDEQEKLQKEKLGDERTNEDKIKAYKEQIDECRGAVNTIEQDEKESYYPKIETEVENISYTFKSIDKVREQLVKDKNEERKKYSSKQSVVRDKIIQKMREYKDKFPSDSLELSDEIEARVEYLHKLEKIQNEGLPAHEATLKTMLNKNTIDDIVAFDNKLDIHEKEIKGKIKNINEHLKEIEFNKGTYIELIADRNRDQDIKTFKDDLKACYSNILDTNDAYTEDRFNDVQKILNRFRSNENKDIDWTNKVTDVRNWFDFNASEKYLETGEEKEFYSGSSGKSGGQKEKLAYTDPVYHSFVLLLMFQSWK